MTDPTIELAEDGSMKMLRVADPEVTEVLVPVQEDDTLEEPMTLDVIAKLTGVGRRIQQVVCIRQN